MSRANPRFHRTNPPLSPVGTTNGIVLYKIIGSLETQLTVSTFMYQAGINAPTQAQLGNLLTAISTNIFVPYKNCITADWTCTSERIDVVHRNDIIGKTSIANAGAAGGRAATHPPTEVAAVMLKFTAVKGQHGRGRLSLPPPSLVDITNSKVTAAGALAAYGTLGTQMLVGASDGTNTWNLCLGTRSNQPPKLIVNFAIVNAVNLNPLLGTIRRRKIGRGK